MTKSFKMNVGYGAMAGVSGNTQTLRLRHIESGNAVGEKNFDSPGDTAAWVNVCTGDRIRCGRGVAPADSANFNLPNCRIDGNSDTIVVSVVARDGTVVTSATVAPAPSGTGVPFALNNVPVEADITFA